MFCGLDSRKSPVERSNEKDLKRYSSEGLYRNNQMVSNERFAIYFSSYLYLPHNSIILSLFCMQITKSNLRTTRGLA
uniref:Uncharacterized protein n=1 Tax=Onchocerca volvulus TaxID=6282 RepID=A0A8R1XYX2_ONCVO